MAAQMLEQIKPEDTVVHELERVSAGEPSEEVDSGLDEEDEEDEEEPIDTGVRVEAKGIYVILRTTPIESKYRWSIFVARSDTQGIGTHQKDDKETWRYVMDPAMEISESEDLLVALKVGVLDDVTDDWMDAVEFCLAQTKVSRNTTFSGRTWAMAAVYELADGGFIDLQPDWNGIAKIEMEAQKLAGEAASKGSRIVKSSTILR
ncbi:hypothetical protein FQN57_001260 [Myotisia sp. PD_48]|nr:hypothetical protein FQN57_001260 [Myotisia sp. PD_48]